jgi:hypothetical protein
MSMASLALALDASFDRFPLSRNTGCSRALHRLEGQQLFI